MADQYVNIAEFEKGGEPAYGDQQATGPVQDSMTTDNQYKNMAALKAGLPPQLADGGGGESAVAAEDDKTQSKSKSEKRSAKSSSAKEGKTAKEGTKEAGKKAAKRRSSTAKK